MTTQPFTEVPLLTVRDALLDRRLLQDIAPPRVKLSKRSIFEPTTIYDDVIISASEFRDKYPEYVHLAGYVESDGFEYLSIQVSGFVLQIMRWL